MDANNRTLNQELVRNARALLTEGITVENCEDIMTAMQSIIQCPYESIYEDVNLGFFIVALNAIEMPTPTFTLLANTIMNKYLYHHLFKVDITDGRLPEGNMDTNGCYNDDWIIYKERFDLDDGRKKVITFKLNSKTNERIDLEEEILEEPDTNALENIFAGFLGDDLKKEIGEHDL